MSVVRYYVVKALIFERRRLVEPEANHFRRALVWTFCFFWSEEIMFAICPTIFDKPLALILLTWRIWWAPNNASRWQMGFNSAFKGLIYKDRFEVMAVGEAAWSLTIWGSDSLRLHGALPFEATVFCEAAWSPTIWGCGSLWSCMEPHHLRLWQSVRLHGAPPFEAMAVCGAAWRPTIWVPPKSLLCCKLFFCKNTPI